MSTVKKDVIGSPQTEALRDLRSTIDFLREEGDLIETDVEVDPDLEITGVQKHLDGGCPILFNNVKDKPFHRAVTNLFADHGVMHKLFGFKNHQDRTIKIAEAIRRPLKPIVVDSKDAPSHEEVILNPADVNEFMVPIRHTTLETELTVGSGQRLFAGEYFEGGTDMAYNRMNFRWGNVGTFQISPGSHGWQIMAAHYRDDKPIPLTMNFGIPYGPNLLAGAGFDYVILPVGCDELGVAGALAGEPVRMVEAKTVPGAYALADAEITLEGYLHPRDRRYETAESEEAGVQGRFHFHPEWAGYMGKAYKAPTFHVTAVTMRARESKPIVFPLGVHTMDCQNIDTTVRESAMYELCHRMQPGICTDVNIPYPMTDWGGAIIQVKKRSQIDEGWQRNFLAAILAPSQGARLAIAMSEDTDIYDMDDVIWNLTTRVNPKTDILNPLPGGRGQTFMPAERMSAGDREWTASNTVFEGGMGIDATVPFGYESDFMRPVYPVDTVFPDKFFSAEDIAKAKKYMEGKGWVHSLAESGR
jgi:gallate decarboxylase subunit C